MDQARKPDLSPAEFLADTEVAVTDRTPDPLLSNAPMVEHGDRTPLSPRLFRRLVSGSSDVLAAAGVHADFGSTIAGPRHAGPTWISLTSAFGYGRLVRDDDGSSRSSAHRCIDGATLVDSSSSSVCTRDFHELIEAVAVPRRG